MDRVSGPRPRRADVHPALRMTVRERGCHLRPAGILNTNEQDLGYVPGYAPLGLGQGGEPITRECSVMLGTCTWAFAVRFNAA